LNKDCERRPEMTNKARPQIKKPENFDLKKFNAVAEKIIRENKEWLKEIADK
jgi:hypothetical protein